MDAAYIEALNTGFLRERDSKGDVRDPFLLDEIDRLNELPSPASELPFLEEPFELRAYVPTTIPPPSWKRD
ncbi:MAG TPA: hypothetical protein VF395_03515 [Polyangiaceae bacterium]